MTYSKLNIDLLCIHLDENMHYLRNYVFGHFPLLIWIEDILEAQGNVLIQSLALTACLLDIKEIPGK